MALYSSTEGKRSSMKCPHLTILFCMTVAAAAAQSPAAGPAFEAASLKLAAPNGRIRDEGGPGTGSPGQWTCTNMPLQALVLRAWDLSGYRLSGPASLREVRYDIVAKVPPNVTRADFFLMIQRLLLERLGLVLHRESREMEVRELVVAKGGCKLKPAEAAPEGAGVGMMLDRDGDPQFPPGRPVATSFATMERIVFLARMQGIDGLIKQLQGPAGYPIVDKTGLTGLYDYTLKVANPAAARSEPLAPVPDGVSGAEVPGASAPAASFRSSFESAMVKQLGLQLRRAKATVDVLVVDSFNKAPAEN
jgi:uncharacterized protein (TIGR03435 family)